MKSFSQRKGLKPVRTSVQLDSIDAPLRNNLWDALTIFYWDRVTAPVVGPYIRRLSANPEMNSLLRVLWHAFFGLPLDTLSDRWVDTHNKLREWFFGAEWYEVYDFIEFVVSAYPDDEESVNTEFMQFCNGVLERHLSAYRFVGGEIRDITSEEEIAEIEYALEATEGLEGVHTHLRTALSMLSDRKSPEYRNSIKESISAVEAICNLIAQDEKPTLGQALKEIEKHVQLHGALKSAFEKLYGYASDAEGIRHALVKESNLQSEDAKFMLVACSAFINYLIAKASRAGITL